MKINGFFPAFRKLLVAGLFLCLQIVSLQAQQIGNYLGDESLLYAETKQVNQFFRRFNNEEDKSGVRYGVKDKRYRELEERKKYIRILFDEENTGMKEETKAKFIADVCKKGSPQFLDFHKGNWFAEVKASFLRNGVEKEVTLFLRLEKAGLGHKWVLSNVYFEPYYKLFLSDTTQGKKFLHPLSHELDFMNLIKAFENVEKVQEYASDQYEPDYLTILLYEIKMGVMKFETVSETKFHFFQIENWYFELSEFNRASYNNGWLISSMVQVNETDKEILKKYIYKTP